MSAVEENRVLRKALRDTLWMARRYADHRCTYTPSLYNNAVRALEAIGFCVEVDKTVNTKWARDGMGRAFDGLTDEEAAEIPA